MDLSGDAELQALFREEVLERTARLVKGAEAVQGLGPEDLTALVRDAHTVKGSCRVMGYVAMGHAAEALERAWRHIEDGTVPATAEIGEGLAGLASALSSAIGADPEEGTPDLTSALERFRARVPGETASSEPVAPARAPASGPPPEPPDLGGLLAGLEADLGEGSVAIEGGKLYRLINRLAEVGVEGRALRQTVTQLRNAVAGDPKELASLAVRWELAVRGMEQSVRELERQALALAAAPLSEIFETLPRLGRYVARNTGKDVRVEVVGDDAEVDRQVLERIADPLRHLLVNAIDHGIEGAEERRQAGKPPTGAVSVRAEVRDGTLELVVADDGRGVDWAAVAAAGGTGERPVHVLFAEGFSTRHERTEFSGDGSGLSLLAHAVDDLNGSVSFETEPGRGTTVALTLPAWRALQDALVVSTGEHRWGIPQAAVADTLPLGEAQLEDDGARRRLRWRGRSLPMAGLAAAVGVPEEETETPAHVLVLNTRAGAVALSVPGVLGTRRVAVKALGPLLSGVPHLAGAAVLGGGELVVMIDPNALGENVRKTPSAVDPRPRVLVVDDSIGVRQLVASTLASQGFEAVAVGDVEQALAELAARPVDALVVDYSMPGSDGIELVRQVRSDRGRLPIVMVSGVAGEEDQRRAAEAGVDAYFDKSDLREGALASTLRSLIEAARSAEVSS